MHHYVCNRRSLFMIFLAIILPVSGCSGSDRGTPAAVPQTTLLTDPAAMQAALDWCNKQPPLQQSKDPAADPCAHVAYAQYLVRSQYAAGLASIGTATQALSMGHLQSGEWATSNGAAGIPTPGDVAKSVGVDKYVESVTVGPRPGAVTVKWGTGALAGKQLVLTSATQGDFKVACWNIDEAATTVPKTYRLGRVPGACN